MRMLSFESSIVRAAVAAGLLVACVPEIEDPTGTIAAPRVLAVRSQPAEAREGSDVALEALVANPDDRGVVVDWTACIARKPLTELGPVAPECLRGTEPEPDVSLGLGTGTDVGFQLPSDACTLFGPERPDPKPGEPAGRPVDPDVTGGFYQPVVAWLGTEAALGAVRLSCPLAGASRAATVDFNQRYRVNQNPAIETVEVVTREGTVLDPASIAPAQRVRFRFSVPSCPASAVCGDGICGPREDRTNCADDCVRPAGCGGAEAYAFYNPETRVVEDRVESLVASWYATEGRFAETRIDGEGQWFENEWTAPSGPGQARLWFTLRDDRGGTDWYTILVDIQ